jgi:hypothetical protein
MEEPTKPTRCSNHQMEPCIECGRKGEWRCVDCTEVVCSSDRCDVPHATRCPFVNRSLLPQNVMSEKRIWDWVDTLEIANRGFSDRLMKKKATKKDHFFWAWHLDLTAAFLRPSGKVRYQYPPVTA